MMKIFFIAFLFLTSIVLANAQTPQLTIKQFADLLNSAANAQIPDARSAEEFAVNHI